MNFRHCLTVVGLVALLDSATAQGQELRNGAARARIAPAEAVTAGGPLRVHPANPRYFTDGGGKAVFVTGSHCWDNFQDYTYATLPSPPAMDFDKYLAFLARHNHNFFRLWVSESAWNPHALQGTTSYDPMPYQRPGPGLALDGKPDPYWNPLREALGLTRSYATRMDLAGMVPRGELASSGYCLADPYREYLIYLPKGGEVTVDLFAAGGELAVEWLHTVEGTITVNGTVSGGAKRVLRAPFSGDAVLYLRKKR